jgi:hypothetical protein
MQENIRHAWAQRPIAVWLWLRRGEAEARATRGLQEDIEPRVGTDTNGWA